MLIDALTVIIFWVLPGIGVNVLSGVDVNNLAAVVMTVLEFNPSTP